MVHTILVMHEQNGDYYRMNKTTFTKLPLIGEHVYNSDGLVYLVEDVVSLAGYEENKDAITSILVVKQTEADEPVSALYGLNLTKDLGI